MKVLIVLTSHDQLGDTGEKTGFWLEEFVSPYYHLKDAGVQVTLASPRAHLGISLDKITLPASSSEGPGEEQAERKASSKKNDKIVLVTLDE